MNETMKQILVTLLMTIIGFITPILPLMYVVSALVIFDLITAILRSWKQNPQCMGFWKKLQVIKSNKLRKTAIKFFCYNMFIGIVFAVDMVLFGGTLQFAKIAMALISLGELYSIAENLDIITGDNVFMRIFKAIKKPIVGWLDKIIGSEEKK